MLPTKVCVWPSRFDRERRGGRECNAKTKIFSSFMDWIGDDMSQIKLIEYQPIHQTGGIRGTCILCTQVCVWPSRFEC